MKQIELTLIIAFSDIIPNNDIYKIAANILNGLIEQANHEGITPEDSEAFTTNIQISIDGKDIIRHKF